MRRPTLLYAICLMLAAQGALAGEDSTHRWHGVGPAWYEVEGGLRRFAAGEEYDPILGRKRAEKTPEKTAPTKPASR
jgi:hypothetical protein